MCPTAKKTSTEQPARPAQSREVTNPDKVMLQITGNHDWLNDFTLSDEPDGDDNCQAVQDQLSQSPSTSPVLKVTGRQDGGQIPIVRSEIQIKVRSSTPVVAPSQTTSLP